jgi:hypothetical protein
MTESTKWREGVPATAKIHKYYRTVGSPFLTDLTQRREWVSAAKIMYKSLESFKVLIC